MSDETTPAAPMESKEKHHIAEQLNYQYENYAGPKYKFSRIVPLSGGQQFGIPLTSTMEVLFEIPTNVFNFWESYLYGHYSIGQQGVGNYINVHQDGMPLIQEIDLYTRSGIYICQLPNFQNYMKIVRKLFTPLTEYKTNDWGSSFLYPFEQGAADGQFNLTPNNGFASNELDESTYLLSNGTMGQAANTQLDLVMNLPMKAIKKTIFALNKDIVFPDIMVLRLLLGPANKIGFNSTDSQNPIAGVTDLNFTTPPVNPAPGLAQPVNIYDLTLYLAVEKNEDLAQSVRAIVNSTNGMNLLIDFPYSYKTSGTGSQQNISLRFNRGHGKNLLAVISSPFNTSETNNTAYDCWNVADPYDNTTFNVQPAKVNYYYSMLDNIRLQDITLFCGTWIADDYRENKKHMKNTPYFTASVYNQNWFHMDKFYEDSADTECNQNLDKGMSLIVERKYDLLANMVTGTAYNWYSHAIVQKDLHIGRSMVAFQ